MNVKTSYCLFEKRYQRHVCHGAIKQGLWKKSMNPTPYILGLIGSIFLGTGLYLLVTQIIFEQSSIPVDIEVTRMIENPTEKRGTYAPEFTIIEGEYLGRRFRSQLYTSPPLHRKGDRSKGKFDLVSGEIQSNDTSTGNKLFSAIFIFIGALLTCVSIAMHYSQKSKLR